jgi:hypothetical protein
MHDQETFNFSEEDNLQDVVVKFLVDAGFFVNLDAAWEFVLGLTQSEQNTLFGMFTGSNDIGSIKSVILDFIRSRIDYSYWMQLDRLREAANFLMWF